MSARVGEARPRRRFRIRGVPALPQGIWALGLVSMFMDISSELIHSLLPLFLATILGASIVTIGAIEGAAEAAAAFTKVFSGAVSDHFRRRKPLALLGYSLAALTKPVFPLASSVGWVFAARFTDRIGKGIRGAPRDALVAEIAPPGSRGAAYGLRQSLDSVGAFVGPLLAIGLMAWLAGDIRKVLWIAVVPALLSVLLLLFGVREPERSTDPDVLPRRFTLRGAGGLSARYWLIVALGSLFAIGRFSEAFLILRAHDIGLGIGAAPAVLVVMNAAYALTAYPAGIGADRLSRRMILVAGLAVLVAADLVLAAATAPSAVFLGAALWGIHMGLTQGLFSKLVADVAPAALRGTAFGIFHLFGGGALLLASLLAGALWEAVGPSSTFIAGALFAGAAAVGLLAFGRRRPPTSAPENRWNGLVEHR